MKVLNWSNETAESLINKAKRNILRDLKDLSKNKSEIYEQFRTLNPALSDAIKNYCSVYKKLEVAESEGLLSEFTEASKALISAFKFADTARNAQFIRENFVSEKHSPLYKAMEAIFDASLFKEEGKARLFTNVYNLQKTIRKVNDFCFVFYAKPYFYYVDAFHGIILRRTDLKVKVFDTENYLEEMGYVYYNEHLILSPFGELPGVWEDATYSKQSGNTGSGVWYKYVRFGKDETGKTFQMPAHHIIALCWYGINIVKFCIGSGSLLTLHHRDENAFNNKLLNLALLTRVDNCLEAKTGKEGINFIMFFEVLGIGSSPFNYVW